ncbi:MAG: hypothetical protein BWK80_04715 [Desulfobacteraceae bacterium IS3]|nr:MAG: hypothetical protein BWK80_04715 [Desulfobacteraceae bacterium IS3]
MQELFKWLSTNQTATIAVIGSFGFLIISICIIYLISFFQGRDISFWPPKIGQKPIKSNTPAKQTNMFDIVFIEDKSNNKNQRIIEGIWKSTYFTDHNPTKTHNHLLELKQNGEYINGQSLEGSLSLHSFKLSGKIRYGIYFTGIWESRLEESVYHGTFQCIIGSADKEITGKWLGTGSTNPINVGNWTLQKTEERITKKQE